jgi:prolyl-tRNA synthetase
MKMTSLLTPTLKKAPAGWQDPGVIRLIRSGYALDFQNEEWNLLPLGSILRENVAWTFLHALMEENFQQLDSLLYKKDGLYALAQRAVQSYRDLPLNFMELRQGLLLLGGIETASGKEAQQEIVHTIDNILQNLNLPSIVMSDETLGTDGNYVALKASDQYIAVENGVACSSCGWTGTENARIEQSKPYRTEKEMVRQEIHTPNASSIEELCEFLHIPAEQTVKTMFYMAEVDDGWRPVAVLIRGDLHISEEKLALFLKVKKVRIAEENELMSVMGQKPGYLGPVGLPERVCLVADISIEGCSGVVTGANKPNYHLTGVTWGRDFKTKHIGDVALLREGMNCPRCGLELQPFLWNKVAAVWSEKSDIEGIPYQDQQGQTEKCTLWKGWIDLNSILTALAREKTYPFGLAPFDVDIIVPSVKDEVAMNLATNLYLEMAQNGIVVLFDDRNERAGAKFADFELFGIPVKVVVGRKAAEGIVEVHYGEDAKEMQAEDVVCFLSSLLNDDDESL